MFFGPLFFRATRNSLPTSPTPKSKMAALDRLATCQVVFFLSFSRFFYASLAVRCSRSTLRPFVFSCNEKFPSNEPNTQIQDGGATRERLRHFGATDSAQTLSQPFGQPEDSIPTACAGVRARVGYCAGIVFICMRNDTFGISFRETRRFLRVSEDDPRGFRR